MIFLVSDIERNGARKMTGRLFLVLLLAVYSIASGASAQSVTQSPFSSTEKLFEHVNKSVCTIIATDKEGNLVNRGSGFILRESRSPAG